MSDQFCDKEAAVVHAARTSQLEPTLRTHLDSCSGCREAARVVTAMSSLESDEAAQIPPTPDPQRVWLKAAFAERQKRSARITQLAGFVYAVLAAAIGIGAFTVIRSSNDGASVLPQLNVSVTSHVPILVVVACVMIALILSTVPARKSR